MSDDKMRLLRAVLRNAATWGAAWAAAGGAIFTAIGLIDPDPEIGSAAARLGTALVTGIVWGVRFGLAGAVVGAAFASVIRLGYRGRRLADINPARFALLGAVVGAVGVPLYLQTMNVLFGDGPIAWRLVVDDARWASVLGAVVAAGSILLARRADALSSAARPDQLGSADDLDGLPAPGPGETSIPRRSRAAKH